jgi:hypothetical protein
MLQVDQGNDAALSLYATEGFRTQYGYHYRALGAAGVAVVRTSGPVPASKRRA